ncbi:four-carbon acid sugar kinase family protein [Salicibibacter cibarius]|uniref:Four-carbon acid sugar kinase family protein n=1 Tax=Salicibibacter cibarius TaxID=2743000 RepID=A0A7T6Z0Q1_9BACI|nr:four-carbon acid sugar kinase family protein [Salicibibacter cibarius]QQK74806.1 four-carbon acid sugar kinase family protein [Salicibibacter cibarius]
MRVGVIADDLTGANATGVKLTKQGRRTLTVLNRTAFPDERYNTLVLNTDSRYLEPTEAAEKIKESFSYLSGWEAELITKRIDSTFRGNIGAEVDAILESVADSVAIIVPAFPDSKRTVRDGRLFVNDDLLENTEVAKDPVKPIRQSSIPGLLETQSQHATALISLDDINGLSSIELQILLQQKMDNGARMICCDAVSNRDVETIAKAIASIQNHYVIPVDPGPLTSYYVQEKMQKQNQDNPVLLIVGSTTSHTKNQIEYLKAKADVRIVYTETEKLASFSGHWEEEIERVSREALDQFRHANVVIITTSHPSQPSVDLSDLQQKKGKKISELGNRITDGLGEIFTSMMARDHFSGNIGLFSSGGEVLAAICTSAKAQGIELIEEIQPLLAYGQLSGGQFDRLPMVTKGGLAGDERAMYDSVRYLQEALKKKEGDCYAR